MKHIVVGTAGHIDHGKTALVRALTGIETDRLAEEKRRGISIDLGFAHLDFGDEHRIAFVDVPGHERFIKNMLAGVGGIDAVLFVVSAEESIKPQTREHFEICRLLRIPRGIIALTKSDAVEPEILDLVRLEVADLVAGSFLESAPLVAVSAVTGEGLENLRRELAALTGLARKVTGLFRLPVDRAFSMKGFGTVVTGTVVAGAVESDQEVEAQPGGQRLRVRGIQAQGRTVQRASAGMRAALNVAGSDAHELRRGQVLCPPGQLRATQVLDVYYEPVAGAKPPKHGAPIHFHCGTAESVAEVRLLTPDARYLRLVLREPMLLTAGDRYVARMFSPVLTIGGGEVLDPHPPKMRRAAATARAAKLYAAPLEQRVRVLMEDTAFGISMADAVAHTGASEKELLPFASIRQPQPWFLSDSSRKAMEQKWVDHLRAFHAANPLAPGMPKEELRTRTFPGPAWVFETLLSATPGAVVSEDVIRLSTHKIALQQDESAALKKIEHAFESAGLAVPSVPEVLASSGVDPKRARPLLQMLLKERKLVRVSEELQFHCTAISHVHSLLAERRGTRFTVGDFKTWTGVSRKYAIPLLEFLDRERVTRREGETRIVL